MGGLSFDPESQRTHVPRWTCAARRASSTAGLGRALAPGGCPARSFQGGSGPAGRPLRTGRTRTELPATRRRRQEKRRISPRGGAGPPLLAPVAGQGRERRPQALEGAHVALAGRRGLDPELEGGVLVREPFEVPQRQDLAIQRLELLDGREHLRARLLAARRSSR